MRLPNNWAVLSIAVQLRSTFSSRQSAFYFVGYRKTRDRARFCRSMFTSHIVHVSLRIGGGTKLVVQKAEHNHLFRRYSS